MAVRYKRDGDLNRAHALLGFLLKNQGSSVPLEIQAKARKEWDALIGGGSFGRRAEFLAGRIFQEATDWKMILPMMAGTAVSQFAKTAVLARWFRGGSRAWYVSRIPARLSSSAVAFVPEVGVFTGLNHILHETYGKEGSGLSRLGKELQSTILTLGALKIFGFLGKEAAANSWVRKNLIPFHNEKVLKVAEGLLPQLSIFAGLMTAHKLEEKWGLRPRTTGAMAFTDTAAALLSMSFGIKVGEGLVGQGFLNLQKDLALRAKIYEQGLNRPGPLDLLPRKISWWKLQMEGGPSLENGRWMMTGSEAGGGGSQGPSGPPYPKGVAPLTAVEDLTQLSGMEIQKLLLRAEEGDSFCRARLERGLQLNPNLMADLQWKVEFDLSEELFLLAKQGENAPEKVRLTEMARGGEAAIQILKEKAWSGDMLAKEILSDAIAYNPYAVTALTDLIRGGLPWGTKELASFQTVGSSLLQKLRDQPEDGNLLTAFANLVELGNPHALEDLIGVAQAGHGPVVKVLFSLAKNSRNPRSREVWQKTRVMEIKEFEKKSLQDPQALSALNLLRRLDHREANKAIRERLDFAVLSTKAKGNDEFLHVLQDLLWSGVTSAFEALAETATSNPRTVFILDQLVGKHQVGAAATALRNLNLGEVDWRRRPEEWAEAMALLVDARHPHALHFLGKMAGENLLAKEYYQKFISLGFSESEIPEGPEKAVVSEEKKSPVVTGSLEALPEKVENSSARKIWEEFLANRPSQEELLPKFPYYVNHRTNSLARAVEAVVRFVPPEIKCIYIDVIGKELKEIGDFLKPVLEKKSTLEEIRLKFLDGTIIWVARVDGEVKFHKNQLTWVRLDKEAIISEREALPDDDPIFKGTDRPKEEIFRIRLLPHWKTSNGTPPFPELLRHLREERGLLLEEVVAEIWKDPSLARELTNYKYKSFEITDLVRLEKGKALGRLQFPVIKRLAEVYHTDVRKLVLAFDKFRFPEIPPRYYNTKYYPAFLEGAVDLDRIKYFRSQPNSSFKNSYGWKMWMGRKNPFHYFNVTQFHRAAQLPHASYVQKLELDQMPPSREIHQGVTGVLSHISEEEWLHAIYQTHFPEWDLDFFFGKHPSFVNPHNQDMEKIALYREAPGKIGQYLFEYRHSLPWYPTVEEMADEVGSSVGYWSDREFNQIPIRPDNLYDWISLFKKIGMPIELLEAVAEEHYGIPRNANAWLLAKAMNEKSPKEVVTVAGVNSHVFTDINQSKGKVPKPASLLKLKEVLPDLNAGELYRRYYPDIQKVFPEVSLETPALLLTPTQIRQAFEDFHLGKEIFSFSMDPPALPGLSYQINGTVSRKELVRFTGISEPLLQRYENSFVNIEKDGILTGLANQLGLDGRVAYLSFRPEILRLFPIKDPGSGRQINITTEEFKELLKKADAGYDRNNLREKLQAALGSSGVDPLPCLSGILGIPVSAARKLYLGYYPPNPQQIKILSENLPDLSYSEWYEHFQHSRLSYFLKPNSAGAWDYRLPEGWDWEKLNRMNMSQYLKEAPTRYGRDARRDKMIHQIVYRLGDTLSLDNIMTLSRFKEVDRRLLFLWARRHQLKPMIEAEYGK